MTITIDIRDVFGRTLYYPADETARLFAALLGVKTLTEYHLGIIKTLGYTVTVKAREL